MPVFLLLNSCESLPEWRKRIAWKHTFNDKNKRKKMRLVHCGGNVHIWSNFHWMKICFPHYPVLKDLSQHNSSTRTNSFICEIVQMTTSQWHDGNDDDDTATMCTPCSIQSLKIFAYSAALAVAVSQNLISNTNFTLFVCYIYYMDRILNRTILHPPKSPRLICPLQKENRKKLLEWNVWHKLYV